MVRIILNPPADRDALADQLIRLIARAPSLVGAEINWIELSADSVLEAFESIDDSRELSFSEVSEIIRSKLAPTSTGNVFDLVSQILGTLDQFAATKADESTAQNPPIPTDETHEFAVVPRGPFERGEYPIEQTYTEKEVLTTMGNLSKSAIAAGRYVIVARPKTQPWTVVPFEK